MRRQTPARGNRQPVPKKRPLLPPKPAPRPALKPAARTMHKQHRGGR
jgi:hypothetical protein